jgi:hypothetical protein
LLEGIALQTVQTNVRVAESDKPLIVQIAARLRAEPSFRDKLATLLEDLVDPAAEERIKKLEQQVSWLVSGAIVVPRATPPTPFMPRLAPAPKMPPRRDPFHAGAEND